MGAAGSVVQHSTGCIKADETSLVRLYNRQRRRDEVRVLFPLLCGTDDLTMLFNRGIRVESNTNCINIRYSCSAEPYGS